jgi:phage repressor protein C with HTH and peptisase S24 domain
MSTDDSSLPPLSTQADRLKWARERFFRSPREAARQHGWNENTYKSHEGGIRGNAGLKLDVLRKYARAFQVPADWLAMVDRPDTTKGATKAPSPETPPETPAEASNDVKTNHLRLVRHDLRPEDFDLPTSQPVDGWVEIPEYDVRLSAGGGTLIESDRRKGSWRFPTDYVSRELRAHARGLSIVEVIGDSMEPRLLPGDRIAVDHSDTNPTPPGIFALWDGFGLVVKHVQRIHGTAKVLLVSENPMYPPYEVLIDEIKIIGRIKSVTRAM